MNRQSSPQGLALVLILAGALTMMAAAAVFVATGEHGWRLVIGGGGFVQFTGWVLHGRRLRHRRGGAR
ncbi:hypothetical protein [Streptomyces sp. NBC_01361]|uniref:hypothetical protein n=1 Tax=Streptomyces sp. NBC_01361 TaxID=2903838 RepID=UPI002E37651A|nr:hypothetical protein [Streptomyces sp. NBC_01361]